jgi:hypothetical protein
MAVQIFINRMGQYHWEVLQSLFSSDELANIPFRSRSIETWFITTPVRKPKRVKMSGGGSRRRGGRTELR